MLREGFVTDEFLDLARTEDRSAEQERRLDVLKREMAERVMAQPAERVYDVTPPHPCELLLEQVIFRAYPTLMPFPESDRSHAHCSLRFGRALRGVVGDLHLTRRALEVRR